MAEVRYRKVKLDEIMDNQGGNSKYSLKYINANPGEYPVYSAKTTGDMNKGYINTYDYDMECLQVTSDGAKAGTIIYREKMKFSVGSATRIWYIKECIENLSLKYIEIKLRSVFFSKEFSWTKKASLYRIKNIEFEIPVDENGNYDIKKQKEIVKKYEIVEEKKQELKEKLDYFKDVQVDFMATELSKSKSMKIKDIFDLSIGSNGSNFTKTFIKNHSGYIPVYGASKDDEIPSYGYVEDDALINEKKNGKIQKTKVKYFNDCLTYNIDGFAGYVFYREGEFSLSEKVRPLIIKDEYRDFLNPEFLKFAIEPIFRNNRKGRLGEDEKNEYTKLYINMIEELEISIPIDKDGKFDIKRQKEIVSKYKAVEEIKNSILKRGLPFTLSNVQFDGENPYIYIYIRLRDLFDIQRGKSIYTKTYCKNNNGKYPVYSADNKDPLGYKNGYDYDGVYLTSSINGIAGVLTILDGKFSANADRVIFIPKVNNINLEYVKNILEPILRNKNKGRKGLKGKNEFTKLTPTMIENEMIPIPYNIYGEAYIEKQNGIAKKYYAISTIKNQTENSLINLLETDIQF